MINPNQYVVFTDFSGKSYIFHRQELTIALFNLGIAFFRLNRGICFDVFDINKLKPYLKFKEVEDAETIKHLPKFYFHEYIGKWLLEEI